MLGVVGVARRWGKASATKVTVTGVGVARGVANV